MASEARRRPAWADPLVGESPALERVVTAVARVAPSRAAVLLEGESGTGKELVARAIHRASRRSEGPFLTENCAALTDTLVESELFGHVRGAFTGATGSRVGIFEAAHGGTLLLDEIGDLGLRLQGKLLRALQEGEIRPVGGSEVQRVDVRVISATHRDLEAMIARGEFRQDLYYRLNVFHLEIPPLRSRPEDVPPLVRHFLAELGEVHGGIVREPSAAALQLLARYPWPGNVRELRNAIERASLLCDGSVIDVGHLPDRVVQFALAEPNDSYGGPKGAERRMIEAALLHCRGNKVRAAARIGWNRQKLYRRMRKLGIDRGFGSDAG